jgi:hypothetical protein
MKSYALFQQYIWLVNTIHKYRKLTLDEINQHWLDTDMSEGLPIARSTFNRHRDAILDMFGVIIECDKQDGFRYYIYNAEVLEEDSIQNWMFSTLSVNSILSESKGVYDRILLEQIPSDGENLHKFIDAMKRGVRIEVSYRKYGSKEIKSTMILEPYLVKLFNKRWYALVKSSKPNSDLFTLAFDRILSLEITNEKFCYDKDFDSATWFRDCYGIVNDTNVKVEKVIVRAFGREANYLRDLPFHHSQKEVLKEDDYSDFELILRPTADFWTPLLSRGAAIKVLQPQWLADEIKQIHQEAARLYE